MSAFIIRGKGLFGFAKKLEHRHKTVANVAKNMRQELRRFERGIADNIVKTRVATDQVLREIIFALLQGLVIENPVDTGRSRAAWLAAGKAVKVKVPNPPPPPGKPHVSITPEGFGKKRATSTFISYTITNGVPYIVFLEMGSSKQQPTGFFRRNVQRIRRNLPAFFKGRKS